MTVMSLTDPPSEAPACGRSPSRTLVEAAAAVSEKIARHAPQREAQRQLPFEAIDVIRQSGIMNIRIPARWGGPEGSISDLMRIVVHVATADSNVMQALLYHLLFIERMRLMATPAQCQRYLPQALEGKLFGGADSERGGQFRGDIQTRLHRQGERYILQGVKHYSTGALFCDLLKIRALNDEGQAVSVVIPADRLGVTRLDDWDGMGQCLTASGTTLLEQVEVFPDEIVHDAIWATQRHHTGTLSQLIHAAIDAGIALAALQDAVQIGRTARPLKESGVDRASEDPYVLSVIGRISAHARAAEAMVHRAALQLDLAADARFGAEASLAEVERLAAEAAVVTAEAKAVTSEVSIQVSQWLFDAGGASAALRQHNHDRHWRNARTHTLHDPVAYKYKAVGNYLLNGQYPPVSYTY